MYLEIETHTHRHSYSQSRSLFAMLLKAEVQIQILNFLQNSLTISLKKTFFILMSTMIHNQMINPFCVY